MKLVLKDGTATLDGVRYTAKELLELFLERVLCTVKKDLETEDAFLGLVLLYAVWMNAWWKRCNSCGEKLGLEKEQIRVIGHSGKYDLLYVKPEKGNLERNSWHV